MFHNISQAILDRMHYLEQADARDRQDGTPRKQRLRQIPPETGKFIALLAASTPAGLWLEIGTSAGYSTLWLALAAQKVGRRITTIELLPDKAALAKETFKLAGVEPLVELHDREIGGTVLVSMETPNREAINIGVVALAPDASRAIYTASIYHPDPSQLNAVGYVVDLTALWSAKLTE